MADTDYEDDFETYEDDFEDEDDLAAPNIAHVPGRRPLQPLGAPQQEHNRHAEGPTKSQSAWPHGSKVDIPMSRAQLGLTDAQRSALAKRRGRWEAIRPQIRLQEVCMDEMFSMPPLSQYELSRMSRSRYRGLMSTSSQTGNDRQSISCQSDAIPSSTASSQAPDDDTYQPNSTPHASDSRKALSTQPSRHSLQPGGSAPSGRGLGLSPSAGSGGRGGLAPGWERRMAAFLQASAPAVAGMLAENAASARPVFARGPASSQEGLSTGSLSLMHTALLQDRPVVSIAQPCSQQPALVLCAYGRRGGGGDDNQLAISGRGMLCVWDLRDSASPAAVLQSEGQPSACCWGDARGNLVVAGMAEGGLCLWDLRENAANHPMESLAVPSNPAATPAASLCCRRPTYTTEAEGDAASAGPIVALEALPDQRSEGGHGIGGLPGRVYTNLISLTAWGDVSVHSIRELTGVEASGAGQAIPGLRIGGRVRLLRTASTLAYGRVPQPQLSRSRSQSSSQSGATEPHAPDEGLLLRGACSLAVGAAGPAASSLFLVGGDDGCIRRGSLYGPAPVPQEFRQHDPSQQEPAGSTMQITCLSFSPVLPDMVLALHDPDSVSIYSIHHSLPHLSVQGFSSCPLLQACWSPGRAGVLLVLDRQSRVHCFDLLRDKAAPVHVHSVALPGAATQATCLQMSPQPLAVGAAAGASPAQAGWLAVGFGDGRVEVHEVSGRFVHAVKDELNAVVSLLR